ncbi:Hypothetical predicted protein [Paramuricea clavata]|nr:Hypothetical predicted protein [Paramuricea clavata]
MGSGHGNSVKKPLEGKIPRNAEAKCQSVPWKDPEPISATDFFELFPKKDLTDGGQAKAHDGQTKTDGKSVSKLTLLVKNSHNQPRNPFAHYGKFDGEGYSRTNKVRLFKIFFPSPKGNQQPLMNICLIVDGARVQDLIGLTMFKYTEEARKPKLKDDVKSYCLLIADEMDGEVDFDLPALDNGEMISKFDFKALALSYIEPEEKPVLPQPVSVPDIIVEVCEEKRGSSKFAVEGYDVKMKTVLEKMLKKRGIKRTGHEYVLVKKNDPMNAINLDDTLEKMDTTEFQLVKRTNIRTRKESNEKNGKIMPDQAEYFTLPQYKVFKVTMLQGFLHAKSEVHLGIDSKYIEITQNSQSSQRPFWNRSPRAVNIEMEYVAHSEVIRKSGNRSTFRLIYSNENRDFKNYDFECLQTTADEIVRKLENILNSSPKSESFKEYQRTRERRSKKS